jgi:hypothetical protein
MAIALFTVSAFSQDTAASYSDTVTSVGLIHLKPFIDKMGEQHPEHMDYWFKTNDNDYFIKLGNNKIIADSLSKFLNSTVQLTYIVIKKGEWDSTGEEPKPVQSRVGPYIVVLKVN